MFSLKSTLYDLLRTQIKMMTLAHLICGWLSAYSCKTVEDCSWTSVHTEGGVVTCYGWHMSAGKQYVCVPTAFS